MSAPLRRVLAVATLLLLLPAAALACILADPEGPWTEKESLLRLQKQFTPRDNPDRGLDVSLYGIELEVTPNGDYLDGQVEITFSPLRTLDAAVFDFASAGLAVTELLLDGQPATFTHADDLITIPLDPPADVGATLVARISYQGNVGSPDFGLGGFKGGYRVRTFTDDDGFQIPGQTIIATLSEPDAARAWWPCHDWPHDAAQVRIAVTAPDNLVFAGPGLRVDDTDLGNGKRRQEWWMPTEIPPYLVSLAISPYATAPGDHVTWRETAPVRDNDGQSVDTPVEYYVPAHKEAAARASWVNTPRMMTAYDDALGPYPYADLKYGMAMFIFGGAMEHPTISSMSDKVVNLEPSARTGGPSWEWITAHELIHQWFGNCAHVERWGEIWLNEGFASYGEVLWYEWEYGYQVGKNWLIDDKWRPTFAGTIRDPEAALFGTTVYRKGAWFLHMLRQVLGDDPGTGEPRLLAAMRAYLNPDPADPGPDCRPVSTADFQAACEQVLRDAGRDDHLQQDSLDWMFTPWLEREGRPQLRARWFPSDEGIQVEIQQPDDHTYRLPLPIRLRYVDGTASDVTIQWVDGASTDFVLAADRAVSDLEIDPDQDWLLDVSTSRAVLGLAPPFPNPFNPALNVEFFLARSQRVTLVVYDVRGRVVEVLADGDFDAGPHALLWDGRGADDAPVASGVYFLQMRSADGNVETRKATLLR